MWFEVDKVGLGKILEQRGMKFVLFELLQNAWDQNVSRVERTLNKELGSRYATVRVEDDDPDGFKDMPHGWTLFAESNKKSDAQKRGRFNLGEKLVLAVCEEVELVTTSGGVRFDAAGRHRLRKRRECGSALTGRLKMTNEEMDECVAAMDSLIPPAESDGIVTTFNGRVLSPRSPLTSFEASLQTVVADAEGNLRLRTRKTTVMVYQPRPGENGTLYEMGMPVLETGDTYHVDVLQKLQLNLDRDNMPPSYLRALRRLDLNVVYPSFSETDSSAERVRGTLGYAAFSPEAIRSAAAGLVGNKAVVLPPASSWHCNHTLDKV